MRNEIKEMIIGIGVPVEYIGCNYLEEAVLLAMETDEIYGTISKNIIPEIAKKYCKTPGSVERAIRTVISHTWRYGNRRQLKGILDRGGRVFRKAPTTLEFLSAARDFMESNYI